MDRDTPALIRPGVLDDAARAAYAPVFDARRDTSGGLVDMEACLAGANLFEVVVDGAVAARYALKQVIRPRGVEVFVLAAVGAVRGVSLTDGMQTYIQGQAAHADCLTVYTRRRGLVKKLTNQGWKLEGYIVRKRNERQRQQ